MMDARMIWRWVLSCSLMAVAATAQNATLSPSPTNNPTETPTATPTFPPDPECWEDLNAIFAREASLPAARVLNAGRTYVLCPDTDYFMGDDNTGRLQFTNGFNSLLGRPNVHYKCGSSGASSNNCRLLSGTYPILIADQLDPVNTNVTLQGLTIESSSSFGMLVAKPGDALLLDCIFRNHENIAPIQIQSPQPFALTVRHSVFEGNRLFAQAQRGGIVVAISGQHNIVLEDVVFRNNDYADLRPQPTAAAWIEGGLLTIKDACFENNVFINAATVLTIGSPSIEATNNYIADPDENLPCPFIAQLSAQGALTGCLPAEATECSFEEAPTAPPSPTAPVAVPTRRPVPRVTRAPTAAPTPNESGGARAPVGMAAAATMTALGAAWWILLDA